MGKKILLVDDDPGITKVMRIRLCAAGYELTVARDGYEGLEAAQRQRPDVVLLDIVLPGMDGFEVIRRLKTLPELSDVPVVFLSAHAQGAARHRTQAAGGACFLPKPYDAGQLMAVIEALAGSRAGAPENVEWASDTQRACRSTDTS